MSYQGTQIGPDGKRRPTGEPDPFVSGVELNPVLIENLPPSKNSIIGPMLFAFKPI